MYQKKVQLHIQTPEGIAFTLDLASPLIRFFAWGVDFLVILAISIFLQQFVFRYLIVIAPDFTKALSILVGTVVSLGYAMILEWIMHGQTFGKRIFGLRVMDRQGLHLHPSQVVMRNLLRVIDSLPLFYLVGGLSSFFSPLYQRLGDRVANTVVVNLPRFTQPDLSDIGEQKFNSLRNTPHLVARLRQMVHPAEADIALQALRRRDSFHDNDRIILFDKLAAHFQAKVSFPEEAMRTCSSEQYIRNVVELVYGTETAKQGL
jgi:uncharacterized RDD family membrane protein YckC